MLRAALCAVALVAVCSPARAVDLAPLRDAVETAAKKGENVENIRTALDAFEKVAPKAAAGRIPAELQALRDAVTAAAKKGENVELIAKELAKVELAIAGRELNPQPRPEQPRPQPRPLPREPNPFDILQLMPNGNAAAGLNVEMFEKAMKLRERAFELLLKDPNDPNVLKEAEKLQTEAAELLIKALAGGGGAGGIAIGGLGGMPFPDPAIGRVPERARLGIRLERVPALTAEQLGLAPNTGIAVTLVAPNSVAEKVGLKVHDIILEFGGKAVTDDTDEFIRRVNAVKAGEKVDLVLLRKGKKVEVKGVELPGGPQARVPGLPNVKQPADLSSLPIRP